MPKRFTMADVTGAPDKHDGDDEQRYGVGGSSAGGGGSDQQVLGWGKDMEDKARKAGAVDAHNFEGAEEDDLRFKITMWKPPPGKEKAFSVNDGPLRTGDTPDDDAFLGAIMDGRIPAELFEQCKGKEPLVDLMDRTGEEYVAPPKPKYEKFGGEGMSVGGAPRVQLDASAPIEQVDYKFELDEGAKMTKLQLNFHDGTKIAQKFNLTHTVQDITLFMLSQKPLPMGTTFELRTSYDKRLLDNPMVTIQDGGLKGEALMQTLT